MELSLESLSSFRPRTGTLEEWNAAYVRVEDYLRAHRIHNRLHQSRLIQVILVRAAKRHERMPTVSPTTLAAEETEKWMDDWFGAVLGTTDHSHERIAIDGRVALLLCDGPQRWPYAFLEDKNVPQDFAQAMTASAMEAGPDMKTSNMVPQPLDFGVISETAGEVLERIERYPLLGMLALWALFLGVLAAIFYCTR